MKGYSAISVNAFYNSVRRIANIAFPFITYKYAATMLSVQNIGVVEFGHSVVMYFVLLAGLGINTYATREGASYKDNRYEFNKFCNEIYGINLLTTGVTYIVFLILIFSVSHFRNMWMLLTIQSLQIILTTLGVEWLYFINENYKFISIRSVVFQIIAIFLLLFFVHCNDDTLKYASIIIFASYGSYLVNFFHSKRYIQLSAVINSSSRKHIKPISTIFFNNIAVQIYANSGAVILGFFSGNYFVGLFSIASKVYLGIKILITSILEVFLPRLSNYYSNGYYDQYILSIGYVAKAIILIGLPLITGVCVVSDQIIIILAGSQFLAANNTLRILACTTFFSFIGMFISNTILLPQKEERYILRATTIGALLNLIVNLILIGTLKHMGAAIAICIAEFFVASVQTKYALKTLQQINIKFSRDVLPNIIGCVVICFVSTSVKALQLNMVAEVIVIILFSMVSYLGVCLLMGNTLVCTLMYLIVPKKADN